MNKGVDDIRRKTHQQVQESLQAANLPAFPELSGMPDLEARAGAFDRWMEERIALWRSTTPQPTGQAPGEAASPAVPPLQAVNIAAAGDELYAWVDAAMLDTFDLWRFAVPGGLASRTLPYASIDTFLQALAIGLHLSRSEAHNFLQNPPQPAQEIPAVYLPESGCLVNLPACKRMAAGTSNKPEQLSITLLQEVTQRKWGLGFVAEYTQLGQELVRSGLWQAHLCQHLGLHLPRWEEQAEILLMVNRSWSIARLGWQEWLWEYLAVKSRYSLPAGSVVKRINFELGLGIFTRILNLFPLFIDLGGVTLRLESSLELLNYLFIEQTGITPLLLYKLLTILKKWIPADDPRNAKAAGLTLRTVIGSIYFSKLEAALGSYCIPYAMLIACNVSCHSEVTNPAELEKKLAADPRLNADTRLGLLSELDPAVKYDPHALGFSAREQLRLHGPAELLIK